MSCTLGLVYFGLFCNVYEYLRILTGTSYTRLHCVVVVVCLRNYFPSYFVHRENVLNIKEILSWKITELYNNGIQKGHYPRLMVIVYLNGLLNV